MKQYTTNDGWDWMEGDMVFSASMMKASVVHAEDAGPLVTHLAAWRALDIERRDVETQVEEANAAAAWKNLELDPLTTRFGALLLADCGSNRKHATFVKFFPVPVSDVTRLALDAQLEAMKDFPTTATEVKLSKPTTAALREVLACLEASKAVSEARKETAKAVHRVSLKQDAWRDEANRRRRVAENSLSAYAIAHDLPRSYPDAFFPSPKSSKKTSAPSDADLVLALPDAALRALAADYVATLPADAQASIRSRLTR
jgi:hypothetical protein